MSTVTIDPELYNEAIKYANNEKMSISGLFELAVRKLMDLHPMKANDTIPDSVEYRNALEYMDKLFAGEQNVSIPADEDGRDARAEKYVL